DDFLCLYSGRLSVGRRAGRRRDQPPQRRHAGFCRHDRRKCNWALRDPDALCDVPERPRAQQLAFPPCDATRASRRDDLTTDLADPVIAAVDHHSRNVTRPINPLPTISMAGLIRVLSNNPNTATAMKAVSHPVTAPRATVREPDSSKPIDT